MKKYTKALVALVAATLIMSMAVVAFATPNITTVTNYTTGSSTQVTVESTVTGAGAGDQVAFLVKENNSGNSNIIWVDQKAADSNGSATFTFKTAAANALTNGSTISVGSTTYAANAFTGDKLVLMVSEYTVTYYATEGGHVQAIAGENNDVDGGEIVSNGTVTFAAYPEAGYELTAIYKNGIDETIVPGTLTREFTIDEDVEFEFEFTEKAASENAAVNDAPTSVAVATTTVADGDSTVNVKQASIAATVADAAEYGVLVAKKASALANLDKAAIDALGYDGEVDVAKFPALGTNEQGQFIINLQDIEPYSFFGGSTYSAVIYAINNNVALSDVFTIE